MPFSKKCQFVDQTFALQECVEASTEGIAIHIQQVLVGPGVMLLCRLYNLKVLTLRIAIFRITLTDVGELHIE